MSCLLMKFLFPSPFNIPPSPPTEADNGGAEFAAEFKLHGFAFEACRDAMFGRPGFIDFPAMASRMLPKLIVRRPLGYIGGM